MSCATCRSVASSILLALFCLVVEMITTHRYNTSESVLANERHRSRAEPTAVDMNFDIKIAYEKFLLGSCNANATNPLDTVCFRGILLQLCFFRWKKFNIMANSFQEFFPLPSYPALVVNGSKPGINKKSSLLIPGLNLGNFLKCVWYASVHLRELFNGLQIRQQ